MCPDWESNLWPFALQFGAQSTEPHRPGQSILYKHESDQLKRIPVIQGMKFRVFTIAYIMNVLTPAHLCDLELSFPFSDHTPDIWLVFCSAFKPVLVLAVPHSWNYYFLPLPTARSFSSFRCLLQWPILREAFFGQLTEISPSHVTIAIMTVTFVNLGSTYYMLGITFSALHM